MRKKKVPFFKVRHCVRRASLWGWITPTDRWRRRILGRIPRRTAESEKKSGRAPIEVILVKQCLRSHSCFGSSRNTPRSSRHESCQIPMSRSWPNGGGGRVKPRREELAGWMRRMGGGFLVIGNGISEYGGSAIGLIRSHQREALWMPVVGWYDEG